MTTFTSDDREEEYKKILAAAPNQPGYEDAVPIPFAGWVNASPPHIVDSGASVMDVGALELANELELSSKHAEDHGTIAVRTGKAVAMLRQQAKELNEAGHMIGVLREYISDLEKGLDSSINLNKAQAERNNKPVAWIPVKELTDEEIWQIYADNLSFRVHTKEDAINLIYCARAILRKAQEK